jgi:hypothetical protein
MWRHHENENFETPGSEYNHLWTILRAILYPPEPHAECLFTVATRVLPDTLVIFSGLCTFTESLGQKKSNINRISAFAFVTADISG